MNLFVITAYRFDQLFLEKRSVVETLAARYDMRARYAEFQVPMLHGGFNLLATQEVIRASDVIIADLTYERPSCYYEVGLAHGLGKSVDLITFEASFAEHHPPAEVLHMDALRVYKDMATYQMVIDDILESRWRASSMLPARAPGMGKRSASL